MSYYVLQQDLRIPGIGAVGEVPDDMDPLDWMAGKKMPAPPAPLVLPLSASSGDVRTDVMGTLLTLFSDELRAALDAYGVTNVDYYPVELVDRRSGEVEVGYWLANVLGLLACVDVVRSTIVPRPSGARGWLRAFQVDPRKTYGLPLFRLHESPTLVVVDEGLRDHLRRARLYGVRMRRTDRYDGY